MRRYRPDSPEAAGRVIAVTLLADGCVSREELAAAFRLSISERIGVDTVQLQLLCEELARDLCALGTSAGGPMGALDALAVRCVLEDVTQPHLRRDVLDICIALAESDRHICANEEEVLGLACALWRLPPPHQFTQKGLL